MRRSRCDRCLRPAGHCLCPLIPSLPNHTHLLVLQHPSEQKHALNTGRLLALGLQRAELLVTELLSDHPRWLALLQDPQWQTELLFPGPQVPVLTASSNATRPRRLVLLDGTWRKARKLLHLNPVLQSLPRASLPAGLHSRYRLRKVPQAGALSSIEAGVEALRLLEPQLPVEPLLLPFDALIEAQINAMGQDVYARNYPR
ncbi:MAG: DTW domain-containing protein [Halopseudomonas sp.]|uniref:tRNA-uridine aminocarboxypropyltransferase n=1 Tax=Halopseudomonas sp. TaxID=2901191 RepID=UPI0030032B7E